jgi:hypothetical protein
MAQSGRRRRAVYFGILLDMGHNADEADAFGRSRCRLIGMGVLGLDKTEWKSRSLNRAFLDKRLLKSMCFDRHIGVTENLDPPTSGCLRSLSS